ncbi:MAG: cupredoxin domain-containing protein [Proteobacteria bacterium]|nr:cupredoxin domain-containing protein [Pseudomonadota bacterium]
MKKKLLILTFITTFCITGAFAAAPNKNIGAPGKASEATRTIEVTMDDNYYKPETISVKSNETIRFVVKNKGGLVHEFNIGDAAYHQKHQKEMMMMVEHGMLEPDRINHDKMKMDHGMGHSMKHDDPNTVLLEPGKQGEVIWKFGSKAKIEIACNVPGHYDAGMVLKVKLD